VDNDQQQADSKECFRVHIVRPLPINISTGFEQSSW